MLAIQDPYHFELPEKYVFAKQKVDFMKSGLVAKDNKTFEESDIEELFMIKEYIMCKQKVEELRKRG